MNLALPELVNELMKPLSTKISTPFNALRERGLIADDDMFDILTAGRLSKQSQNLLGFAVAYLKMKSSGIPISDAIKMSANQKRRVNLGWSAKRWKVQHDKLTKSETLLRLSKQIVYYDLKEFEELLPRNFSGYLIKNSFRLGCEGLRQQHCVASYHSRIEQKLIAICTVFIDKVRWTVELKVFKNELYVV